MWRTLYNKMTAGLRTGTTDILQGDAISMPIEYRKRPNARRYILRLNATGDGGCVTIPRGGSLAEAQRFAQRNAPWLEERLRRCRENAKTTLDESKLLFRGEEIAVEILETRISFGGIVINRGTGVKDARARIKQKLWALAKTELPARVTELAKLHGLTVKRVSVRDQRSRWGSCSMRGGLSLNWRLIQTPDLVRDYIIVHELMHLREMNHSSRFWKLVYAAFPQTDEAERWLKQHAGLLRTANG
jgi:predicted metal-dependent hydrolase